MSNRWRIDEDMSIGRDFQDSRVIDTTHESDI